MFIMSLWVMHYGMPPMLVGKMPEPTMPLSAVESLWAFVRAFFFGFFFALIYDLILCLKKCCCRKSECKACPCCNKTPGVDDKRCN
jgi:hypothetical protein